MARGEKGLGCKGDRLPLIEVGGSLVVKKQPLQHVLIWVTSSCKRRIGHPNSKQRFAQARESQGTLCNRFISSAMSKLVIVANFKTKADKADFVKTELEKLIPPTQAEAGFIQYDLHRDNCDPTRFMFYEQWESRDLWQEHMKSQHLADYVKNTEGCFDEFVVWEMTKIAGKMD